jgi:hypothetical protein
MSEQFHGWGAFGADSIKGNFKEFDYTPKPFDDDDIESEYFLFMDSGLLLSDSLEFPALSHADLQSTSPTVVFAGVTSTPQAPDGETCLPCTPW